MLRDEGRESIQKVVLIIEYDGTSYHGFQLQAGLPTIQSEIEEAINKLTGEKLRIIGASRTDAGVHATGQVVSFRTRSPVPLRAYVYGLNHYLPEDIAVRAAYKVKSSFNVRRDAVSREYKYYILNSQARSPLRQKYSYWFDGKLDLENMNRACQSLLGRHDFISFATSVEDREKSTVRDIFRAEVERIEDTVVFTIVANSFLPHQVRNTVGALIQVGWGKTSPDSFKNIIEAKKPGLAGPTAPACGLCLLKVNYPVPFEEIYNEDL